jgi:hypothetical protein
MPANGSSPSRADRRLGPNYLTRCRQTPASASDQPDGTKPPGDPIVTTMDGSRASGLVTRQATFALFSNGTSEFMQRAGRCPVVDR